MVLFIDSWKRDLTREGIEPNPGPNWDEFIGVMEKVLGSSYEDYEEDLKKNGRLYKGLVKWKEDVQGKRVKSLLADALLEYCGSTDDEITANLEKILGNEDDQLIKAIVTGIHQLRAPGILFAFYSIRLLFYSPSILLFLIPLYVLLSMLLSSHITVG